MAPAPHEILLPRLARVSLCFGSSHVIGSLAKRIQRSYTRQCVVLVAGQGDAQCDSNQESRPCQRDLPLSLYRVYRVSPLLLSFLPRSIFSLFFFLFSSVPPFFCLLFPFRAYETRCSMGQTASGRAEADKNDSSLFLRFRGRSQ